MLRNLVFFFSQIVFEKAKIYSAKLGYDWAIAKINSAKFTIFALVNRENKFHENLCLRKFTLKITLKVTL